MSYNGYSNYETWNVVLWIEENTQNLYDAVHKYQRLSDAEELEDFVNELARESGHFGDLEKEELTEVNWQEAYDMIYAD